MSEKRSGIKAVMHNLIYAFAVQGISLLLSMMMSLVVPKILGEEQFSYWQLFLFYVSYVGFFSFGFIDGIYLRYGGKRYEDLDDSLLCTEFWISAAFQIILTIFGVIYTMTQVPDPNRQFVLYITFAYMVVGNVGGMLCYVFQATNRVNVYSTSVLIDKMSFIVAVLVLLFYKERSFVPFILLYLTGKTISFIYTVIKGRDMVFHKGVPIAQAMPEVKINVFTGITLMLSNIASMLILGSGRFVVDNLWGINAFGKFSFSVSLANFFLLFISQASMVLFPVLRQANDKNLKKFYSLVRDLLDLVLPGAFLFYIPVKVILSRWLPQYTESLTYLVLLLPLCTFDSKMNLLCTTYMKVLRLERTLLWINGISFGVSIGLSLLGGYVFHNIYMIIVFMVVSVAFREILSEWVLSRFLELPFLRSVLTESILSVGFVCFTWLLPSAVGFVCYVALYGGYLLIFRKSIRSVLHESRRVFRGK